MSQEEVLDSAIPQDVHDAEESTFSPLPAGEYVAVLEQAKVVPTKDKLGRRLKLLWKVSDGQFAGRVVFDDINETLPNSPKAQEIGRSQIKNRLSACGREGAASYAELVGCEALLKLKIRSDDYGDKNEVVIAKPIGAAATSPAAQSGKATAAAAPARTKPKFA